MSMNRTGVTISNEARRLQEQIRLSTYKSDETRLATIREKELIRKDMMTYVDTLVKSDMISLSDLNGERDHLRERMHGLFTRVHEKTGVCHTRELEFAACDGYTGPIQKRKNMAFDL